MDFPLSPLSYFSFSLFVVKPIVPRSLSFSQSLAIKLGGDPVSSGSISRLYSQEHRGVKAFSKCRSDSYFVKCRAGMFIFFCKERNFKLPIGSVPIFCKNRNFKVPRGGVLIFCMKRNFKLPRGSVLIFWQGEIFQIPAWQCYYFLRSAIF